ncbi:MAG TPA: YceI family protein [Saprospiraceae bacterium]|nr:YceI family protein [Saprospiraceae bacterium]HPI05894.1 YceI family protein [Saprospiraceae bacterium]
MKKIIFVFSALFLLAHAGQAQKFFTRDAKIKFSSETPMEKIEGLNKSGTCVLDAATGKMEWKVLIKGFLFEKALMQEHFNENYLESSVYPNAQYKGQITNLNEVKFNQDGKYNVKTSGKLTIHGVERDVNMEGTLKVSNGNLEVLSNFVIKPEDYKITIPSLVKDNIAKEIKVVVSAVLAPLKS